MSMFFYESVGEASRTLSDAERVPENNPSTARRRLSTTAEPQGEPSIGNHGVTPKKIKPTPPSNELGEDSSSNPSLLFV